MSYASEHGDTFLNVEACNVFGARLDADTVVLGASDGRRISSVNRATQRMHLMRCAGPSSQLPRIRRVGTSIKGGPLLDQRIRIRDGGNLPTDPATPERNRDLIRTATGRILGAGAVPVLLGGDDSDPVFCGIRGPWAGHHRADRRASGLA